MVRNYKLFNPVRRTADMKESEFTKYVDIAKSKKTTSLDMVEEIEHRFFMANYTSIEKQKLDDIWGFIRPKIEHNPGLAEFTLDYDGAESFYFFPWLINIFRSPSTALEMAYGAGTNLEGEWSTDVLRTEDPIVSFVENDPTFVYNRERQLYVADLVTTCQEIAKISVKKRKVVDFGAGRLAWARWHGFEFEPTLQSIYAFDKDPTVVPSELFEENLEDLNLHYKHGDLMAQLKNPDCKEADLVILGGVASYIPPDIFAKNVIEPIYELLDHDGIFFFDLQIDCPYLRRSMKIFDWPELTMPKSISAAIDELEKIRKALWRRDAKFSVEYAVDTYNEKPSALMVTMQKVS